MQITLLGTGTSNGVPAIGCCCAVCKSHDWHDNRLRSSALVETGGLRILIDCGPDFRAQMLHRPFAKIDAVLITHEHYDHIGGLDDLRPFCKFGPIDIFAGQNVLDCIRHKMEYAFEDEDRPRVPHFRLNAIQPFKPFFIKQKGGLKITPLRIMHGDLPILGYKIGDFAYITDMKTAPKETEDAIRDVELLVINGLRHKPHPTHQTVEMAVELVQRLGIPQARIIHLAHSAGLHAESKNYLPKNISFGFDGEILNL